MVRSWIRDAVGGEEVFARLARGMAGSELWSVLMEVVRERARERSPAEVLAHYARDGFVQPAPVDQRVLVELSAHLLAAAPDFEALELSPVAPLGTCSSVALTDQHRVLASLRNTEVVSDPTNVLALECARRLARAPAAPVRLTTSQRVLRAQQLPDQPGYSQHFQIFVLASAGREQKAHGFLLAALAEHVRTMLAALERLEAHGYAFGRRRLDLLSTPARRPIAERLSAELCSRGHAPASTLEGSAIAHRALTHGYYSAGLRYMLWVEDRDGNELPLIDGGAFDWLARLTSNARYAFVASGMGAQLAALRFRTATG